MRYSPKIWQKNHQDTISLCMIMRNEEKRLKRCIDSVKGLVQEIIITDTGSRDGSIALAQKLGCKVWQDPWQDDFSRPRNISIDHATKNYILILDPDEVLSHADHPKIREHTLQPKIIAWRMDTRNYTNNLWQAGNQKNPRDFFDAKNFAAFVPSIKTRLFQNWRGIHFRMIWHEMLDYDIIKLKCRYATSPVQIHHYPHEINQDSIQEKKDFYLRLGRKKVALAPDDCHAQWELAVSEHISDNHRRAYKACLLSLRDGKYSADRLYLLASIAKHVGTKESHSLIFEKAVCMTYPNLTHIKPNDKIPLHAAPPQSKRETFINFNSDDQLKN